MVMNFEQLIISWSQQEDGRLCTCWVIKAPEMITLHPGKAVDIVIPFEGHAPKTLMQVNRHMNDKSWKVNTEYIYFNHLTNAVVISLTSTHLTYLSEGQPICHVEMLDPQLSRRSIKGKFVPRPNLFFILAAILFTFSPNLFFILVAILFTFFWHEVLHIKRTVSLNTNPYPNILPGQGRVPLNMTKWILFANISLGNVYAWQNQTVDKKIST
jgi:hypothetical protein